MIWYRKATYQGCRLAPISAGPLEDGEAAYLCFDFVTALRLLRPLADQGSAKAQYCLGRMYGGGLGMPQDIPEAAKWDRKAADQGFAAAQTELGRRYHGGQGVPQDLEEATKWWRKAADSGNPEARYYLGRQYEQGEGVPQDYAMAHMWFNLAAALVPKTSADEVWVAFARVNRDRIAAKMTPSQLEEAQKLAREWKPK